MKSPNSSFHVSLRTTHHGTGNFYLYVYHNQKSTIHVNMISIPWILLGMGIFGDLHHHPDPSTHPSSRLIAQVAGTANSTGVDATKRCIADEFAMTIHPDRAGLWKLYATNIWVRYEYDLGRSQWWKGVGWLFLVSRFSFLVSSSCCCCCLLFVVCCCCCCFLLLAASCFLLVVSCCCCCFLCFLLGQCLRISTPQVPRLQAIGNLIGLAQ